MLIQYGASVASQQGSKPSLVWRMIALEQITDIGPGPSGKAVLTRPSAGIPGLGTQLQTWEEPDALMLRAASLQSGEGNGLASQADKDAAQAAYDES